MPGRFLITEVVESVSSTDNTARVLMFERLSGAARTFLPGEEQEVNCSLILQAAQPTSQKPKQVH